MFVKRAEKIILATIVALFCVIVVPANNARAATSAAPAPSVVDNRSVQWFPIVPCGLNQQPLGKDNKPVPKSVHDYTQDCNQCLLVELGKNLIDFVFFGIVPMVGTLLFLWAGFKILWGGKNGSASAVGEGTKIMTSTAIGIAIILSSWLITNLILKELANDDRSANWYKIECRVSSLKDLTDATVPSLGGGTSTGTGPGTGGTGTGGTGTTPGSSALSINTSSLPDAAQDLNYTQSVAITGGQTPYVVSVSSGALPSGLSITGATISGKPTSTGTSTFIVQVEDSSSPKQSATKSLTIKVSAQVDSVIISDVASSNITATGATITWKTNKPSNTQVFYGPTVSYGGSTPLDNTLVTSHSVTITGLNSATSYNYQASSAITEFTAKSSNNTFKTLTGPTQSGGSCTGASCTFSGRPDTVSCSAVDPGDGCNQSAVGALSAAITSGASGQNICSGIDTVKLLKAIVSNESRGQVDLLSSDGLSAGPFQLTVATATQYKTQCGVTDAINFAWLRRSDTVSAQACIAAKFIASFVGACGCDARQLAAGYNGGGGGACNVSSDCGTSAGTGQCSVCASQSGPTRRWECLWDDTAHTSCNSDRSAGTLAFTRRYAPKVEFCYNKF